jgi:tetratricopeptide (TPR) repeat protein
MHRYARVISFAPTSALALVVAAACGASPQGLAGRINRVPLSGAQVEQHRQLVAEGDAAWEQRGDRAKLEEAIAKWDAATKIKDDDHDTYTKLATAAYQLADGWLAFTDDNALYLFTHQRGVAYAERGMAAISTDFEKRRMAGTTAEDAVKVLGRNGVPLMYWYATNVGKWAKAKGFSTVLKNKERIFKIVSRVYELDRDYFYGAPDRYFGAFYAIAPAFAGGDLEKSYQHFQESLKREPKYLATYVLIAELYAPKVQDPAVFDEHLKFVMDAPLDIMPGLEPETAIEKKKATRLLEKRDELF